MAEPSSQPAGGGNSGNAELKRLWSAYAETRDDALRDQLILTYLPLVRSIAARLHSRLPDYTERDDLISDGVIGLMEAVERFRPEAGNKFETFAVPRIQGAMVDAMRSLDWTPRSLRSQQRKIDQILAKQMQLHAGEIDWDAVAAELQLSREELDHVLVEIGRSNFTYLDATSSDGEGEDTGMTLADRLGCEDDPLTHTIEGEQREALIRAIDGLPDRERMVLVLFYYEELPLKTIGDLLSVSESRISQLQRQATVRLESRLRQFELVH